MKRDQELLPKKSNLKTTTTIASTVDIPIDGTKVVLPKSKKRKTVTTDIPTDIRKEKQAPTEVMKKKTNKISFKDGPTREGAIDLQQVAALRQLKGLDISTAEAEVHKRAKAKRKRAEAQQM